MQYVLVAAEVWCLWLLILDSCLFSALHSYCRIVSAKAPPRALCMGVTSSYLQCAHFDAAMLYFYHNVVLVIYMTLFFCPQLL